MIVFAIQIWGLPGYMNVVNLVNAAAWLVVTWLFSVVEIHFGLQHIWVLIFTESFSVQDSFVFGF